LSGTYVFTFVVGEFDEANGPVRLGHGQQPFEIRIVRWLLVV